MVDFDAAAEILDELVDDIPSTYYSGLNGGVVLMEDIKHHPELKSDRYYVMGEYVTNGYLGRFIRIYYGSFATVYAGASIQVWKDQLRKTLQHELRHHVESLAGNRDLEIEDAIYISRAKEKMRGACGDSIA